MPYFFSEWRVRISFSFLLRLCKPFLWIFSKISSMEASCSFGLVVFVVNGLVTPFFGAPFEQEGRFGNQDNDDGHTNG